MTTVGIVVDSAGAPSDIADHLRRELPELLAGCVRRDTEWAIDIRHELLPALDGHAPDEMLEYGWKRRLEEKWDLILTITDLPLSEGRRVVVAEMSARLRSGVLSVPAFGAYRVRKRVTEAVVEIVAELAGWERICLERRGSGREQGRLPRALRVESDEEGDVTNRIVASLSRLRLLLGMIMDNRPWRLLTGLRGAIVAAFAFSSFWMVNPTIWRLGNAHGPFRLAIISTGTIIAMVIWLILYHHLWVSVKSQETAPPDQALLFNSSTVFTLFIGVSIAYLILLIINFIAANLVVADDVLSAELDRPVGLADYATLVWFATSGATVVGALGAGFESEQSVREATYSRREQERRARFEQDRDTPASTRVRGSDGSK